MKSITQRNGKAGRLFAPVSLLGRINDKMKPYQERVVAEKKELDERGDKLDQFILSDNFANIPVAEQERMKRQLRIMGEYSEVLGERIAAFAP